MTDDRVIALSSLATAEYVPIYKSVRITDESAVVELSRDELTALIAALKKWGFR